MDDKPISVMDQIWALIGPHWQIFVWGFFGSAAVEIAAIIRRLESPGRLPVRYKKRWYWLVRTLYGFVSGMLAVAYGIDNAIVAIHIGIATPLILSQLAKRDPVSGADPAGIE